MRVFLASLLVLLITACDNVTGPQPYLPVHNVTVSSTSTGSILAVIELDCEYISEIRCSSSGDYAYVAGNFYYRGTSLTQIDCSNFTVGWTFYLGPENTGMPDFCLDYQGAKLYYKIDRLFRVLNIPSGNPGISLDLYEGSRTIEYRPGTDQVYVVYRNWITIIDAALMEIAGSLDVGGRDAVFSESGTELYLTNSSRDSLLLVDPGAGSILAAAGLDYPARFRDICTVPGSDFMYAIIWDNSLDEGGILQLDRTTLAITDTLMIEGSSSDGMLCHVPGSDLLYAGFSNYVDPLCIAIVSMSDLEVVGRIEGISGSLNGMCAHPSGYYVLCSIVGYGLPDIW